MNNNKILLFFCALLIIVKLFAISFTSYDLYGDEAQYWLWSKDLSFGYFSKPPLLSWIISLVTNIFGDSFFVLKSIPVVIYCLTSYCIFIFTKNLFNNKDLALTCSLTFLLMPAVSLSSFLISTDVILILFWTIGLIQILNLKNNPSKLNFALLGIVIGLSFLAKYAAIYFVVGIVIIVIIDKNYRLAFCRIYNFISLVFSFLLVVLPNILWNYFNDWSTLNHTAANAALNNINFNLIGLISFLSSQAIMVGPLLSLFFIYYIFKKKQITQNEVFLMAFALPALIIVSFESFLVRAHANWAAASLVTLSIFFIKIIYEYNKKTLYFNNYFNFFIGLVLFIIIGTSYQFKPFERVVGIESFVKYIDSKAEKNISSFVVSDRLLFASLSYKYRSKNFNFYSPFIEGTKPKNHFQLKNPLPTNFSKNFVFVGDKNDISYVLNIKEIKFLGSESFPFSKEKLEVYEVKIQ